MPTDFAAAGSANLATISLQKLASTDKAERKAEIDRLASVCETVGFFYLYEHGLSDAFIDRMFAAARTFFVLPHDVKQRWDSSKQVFVPQTQRGYHAIGVEHFNERQDTDYKQGFEIGPDRPFVSGVPFTGATIAPSEEEVPGFMSTQRNLLEHVMKQMVPILARAFALALNVEEDYFEKNLTYDKMLITQRVAHYPARIGAAGRHTDSGLFTLLLQTSQRGDQSSLKLFTHGTWRNVQAKKELIVVNLGNCLQMWSSGRFVSTPHQVVHRGETDRLSVPIFVYPNADTRIVSLKDGSLLVPNVGEMYVNDINDIWKTGKGAGNWTLNCKGRDNACKCWKCV